MSASRNPAPPLNDGGPVQVRVRGLTVHAGSGIDARRLADALPAALGRAFTGAPAGSGPADRVAAQVLAQVRTQVRLRSPRP